MPPVHVMINESKTNFVLQKNFICYDCGRSFRPDARANRIIEKPVLHAMQTGKCPHCGALHFVATAKTKADCVALEPIVEQMIVAMTNAGQA